jgi:hypothetical protein
MGGNAIRGYADLNPTRLSTRKMNSLAVDIIARLSKEDQQYQISQIASYTKKADHGDLDIVVSSDFFDTWTHEEVKDAIGAVAMIRNNSTTSYAVPVGNKHFQVDLIAVNPESFDFAANYFAWNDLGNLLGRIAHRMGFKFGHDGLWYVLRDAGDPVRVIDNVLITRDFDTAIGFLGYDSERFHTGFKTLNEIFEYTLTSPFSMPEIYLLENRNSVSRRRDAKRPTYTAFLQFLETKTDGQTLVKTNQDQKMAFKREQTIRAMDAFPEFYESIHSLLVEYDLKSQYASVYNGNIVMSVTGLEGKSLGKFLTYMKTLNLPTDLSLTETESLINNAFVEYTKKEDLLNV